MLLRTSAELKATRDLEVVDESRCSSWAVQDDQITEISADVDLSLEIFPLFPPPQTLFLNYKS